MCFCLAVLFSVQVCVAFAVHKKTLTVHVSKMQQSRDQAFSWLQSVQSFAYICSLYPFQHYTLLSRMTYTESAAP